jgi:tetratricopeptide (TPR) repeat protein
MYEQSIPDFQRAIELAPDFPDAHHNLGVAYFATNNMQKAIAEFNIAIEVARKNGNVFVQAEGNLGRAYSKSGEIAKAVVHFTKAIELAKLQRSIDPYPYYLGRADVFQKLGDIDKAQADYQEACTRAKKGCDKLIGNKGSLAK